MKKILAGISIICFVVLLGSNLFAEEKRVIEESLVLKDPTVSGVKKWAVGGSFEYWYTQGKAESWSNGVKVVDGTVKGSTPGGNIFVGYDDFTVQFSYRPGEYDWHETNTLNNDTIRTQEKIKEYEISLRYLFRGKDLSPYLIVGYNDISKKSNCENITWGDVWSNKQTFKSAMAGIGLILPITQDFGLRGDIRGMLTKAELTWQDGSKSTGSGVGAYGTLTGYYNIYQGLNLQAGGKYQSIIDGGSKGGVFASLGYTYRF